MHLLSCSNQSKQKALELCKLRLDSNSTHTIIATPFTLLYLSIVDH